MSNILFIVYDTVLNKYVTVTSTSRIMSKFKITMYIKLLMKGYSMHDINVEFKLFAMRKNKIKKKVLKNLKHHL